MVLLFFFFFKQKTAYEIGLGIPAEPLFRSLFLLVLILLLMRTLNFLPVWLALSLLRFRLPSRLPLMFILWVVATLAARIPSRRVWPWASFPLRRPVSRLWVSWFALPLPVLP